MNDREMEHHVGKTMSKHGYPDKQTIRTLTKIHRAREKLFDKEFHPDGTMKEHGAVSTAKKLHPHGHTS